MCTGTRWILVFVKIFFLRKFVLFLVNKHTKKTLHFGVIFGIQLLSNIQKCDTEEENNLLKTYCVEDDELSWLSSNRS